jgi:hypothetical protein
MEEEVMYDGPSEMVVDEGPMEARPRELRDLVAKEYKPKRQESLREYELRIKFLSVGCVVSVGCKEIPFRSVKEAMEEVNKYVENPYDEQRRWNKIFDGEE